MHPSCAFELPPKQHRHATLACYKSLLSSNPRVRPIISFAHTDWPQSASFTVVGALGKTGVSFCFPRTQQTFPWYMHSQPDQGCPEVLQRRRTRGPPSTRTPSPSDRTVHPRCVSHIRHFLCYRALSTLSDTALRRDNTTADGHKSPLDPERCWVF